MEDKNLINELHHLNQTLSRLDKRQSVTRSFFVGIISGLGSIMGATIVFAVLAYFLRNVAVIPLIGNWLAQIVEYVKTATGT